MAGFSWVGYKKLNWSTEDGYKYYEGRFRKDEGLYRYVLVNIRFWAKHPVKVMRYICKRCKSIEDVIKFDEKKVEV